MCSRREKDRWNKEEEGVELARVDGATDEGALQPTPIAAHQLQYAHCGTAAGRTGVDGVADEGVLGALDPHHPGVGRPGVHPDAHPDPRPVRRDHRPRHPQHVLESGGVAGRGRELMGQARSYL